VLGCKPNYPQGFAEFPSLGAFALRRFPEWYYIYDDDAPVPGLQSDAGCLALEPRLRQFWSHGGITPAIQKEIEACLA
jgi:hypothetical protein